MKKPTTFAVGLLIHQGSISTAFKIAIPQSIYTITNRPQRQLNFKVASQTSKDDAPFFASEVTNSESTNESKITPSTSTLSNEVLDDASSALQTVGWSAPMTEDELTSNDPFVQRLNAQIQEESGVTLDELLNPAKVVNLERDLYNLRAQLASLTGKAEDIDVLDLSTEECDGGGGGPDADALRKKIQKKEKDLFVERRSVFRGWLKNIFLGQAVLSLGLSWFMATDPALLFGRFDWFHTVSSIDVSIQVLGFWWWWLFIVPSLRSRRPKGAEKSALDIAFIGTPLISILAPIATKDTGIIWASNFAVVAGAYAFAFATYNEDEENENKNDPAWLKFIYKSLDVGSGQERGVRK